MKLLWHSNSPHAHTGYGSQTDLFVPMIKDAGHDVAISAFYGHNGRIVEWNGIPIYPASTDYGSKWLPYYARHWGGGDSKDVQVVTLMDVWVLNGDRLKDLNLACWCPVDHTPIPPGVLKFFKESGATPIAMSKFGQEQLEYAGLDPLYVPHGIDTGRLRQVDGSARREAMQVSQDAFVVGMVAANKGNAPPRKAFAQAFTAFAMFHKQHPDAMLYLHTNLEAEADGIDISRWLDVCGVPEDAVRVVPQFEYQIGISYDRLAEVYSSLDVLLAPSYGEGFGIPIMEAQACGTPVIVNDFSAMPELCGAGWCVEGQPEPDTSQGAWWQSPNVGSIIDALEQAYDKAAGLRLQAREFAVGYDTCRVMAEHWTPVLAELEKRMQDRPVELKPKALAA